MRTPLLFLLIALATGCSNSAISPHLDAEIILKRTSPTTVLIRTRLKNLGERATVPIDVEVTASNQGSVIHPAAFVLNRKETRELDKSIESPAPVHATLVVKEAERGLTVVTKTAGAQ